MKILKTAILAAIAAAFAAPAFADGDLEKGKKVFNKCKACHAVGEGAKNKIGPQLNGIAGAKIASVEGYRYSKAFLARKEEGLVWNDAELDAYLLKPRDHTPGTKMSFVGLRTEADRINVIAYLKTYE